MWLSLLAILLRAVTLWHFGILLLLPANAKTIVQYPKTFVQHPENVLTNCQQQFLPFLFWVLLRCFLWIRITMQLVARKGCHIPQILFLLLGSEEGLKLRCSALDCMRLKFNNFAYLNTNEWKTSCLLYMCDVCFCVILLASHGWKERGACMQGRGCCALSSSLNPTLLNPNLILSFFVIDFVVVLPESYT